MRIGIIGGGQIGSTLAKLWVDAGHDVCLSSRHPEGLQSLASQLGTRASTGTPAAAASFGDAVLLAVPLNSLPELVADIEQLLAGKVVMDTSNAYERRDGEIARDATAHPQGSAGWAAAMFPASKWVKAFNTVYFKTLASEAHRAGDRLGVPLASDSNDALQVAAALVRDAGFEPVITGALESGRQFEPDTKLYNSNLSGSELRRILPSTGEAPS
jgi:8-hydroxy-5-deazaflavin:NADPH oxidoreductase